MGTKKRWLKWNGIYDLAGICNQPLDPLVAVANAPIKAVKERLYLLGFNCGELDNNLNDETKGALRTFNGYWNHPTIHKLVDPVVLPPNPPAPLLAPFFDDKTIDCLKEIEDDKQSISTNALQQRATRSAEVLVTRNRIGRTGYSTTLNSATPLAVKIISTPKQIAPFAEYAGIKIEIRGFEKVNSLLFRIYRNFDPQKDVISIPGEQLVYQEILNREGAQGLFETVPKNNIGIHHKAKAFILRYEATGGFSGFFNSTLGVASERLHAPYKVRVWVSTIENFFDDYVFEPTAEIPSSRKIYSERKNLHYLDSGEREEVQRGRKESLTLKGLLRGSVTYRNEPEINHMETVHDLSFLAWADKSESKVIKKQWDGLVKWNLALKRAKYWTAENSNEINLLEEPCDEHNARFLLDNTFSDEFIMKIFADDPVGTYLQLRKRLDAEGDNFKFTELSEVFSNIEKHINIITRRLCCGQWKHLEDTVKDDLLSFIEGTVTPERIQLVSQGYPYERSILFCEKFISLFSLIVHEAIVRPELDFYKDHDLQKDKQVQLTPAGSPQFAEWLRDRRNNIDGCRSNASSEYGINPGHNFHTAQNTSEKAYVAESNTDTFPKLKNEVESYSDFATRQIGKPILLPSYNPLDPLFFVKIRAVPMYAIGMIDMQYLNADGIRQIPVGFFEHDMFHVCTPRTGTQQWKTLYNRLCEVIDAHQDIPLPAVEKLVYVKWHENIDMITKEINNYDGKKKDALSFLFFWLLHEPRSGDEKTWLKWLFGKMKEEDANARPLRDDLVAIVTSFPHPAMPEPTLMSDRFIHGYEMAMHNIREENETDFFGDYSRPLMQHLDWAATKIAFLIPNLDDLID